MAIDHLILQRGSHLLAGRPQLVVLRMILRDLRLPRSGEGPVNGTTCQDGMVLMRSGWWPECMSIWTNYTDFPAKILQMMDSTLTNWLNKLQETSSSRPFLLSFSHHPNLAKTSKNSSGWWFEPYPSEHDSQVGWLFPIYGKIQNVPNHQPEFI